MITLNDLLSELLRVIFFCFIRDQLMMNENIFYYLTLIFGTISFFFLLLFSLIHTRRSFEIMIMSCIDENFIIIQSQGNAGLKKTIKISNSCEKKKKEDDDKKNAEQTTAKKSKNQKRKKTSKLKGRGK